MAVEQAGGSLVASYAGLLRRRWWLIVVMTLVAGAGAWGYEARKTPRYEATAEALVEIGTGSTSASASLWDLVDPALLANEIKYANSELFRNEVARRTGRPAPDVRAQPGSGASTILFTAASSNAQAAADSANDFAAIFGDLRAERLLGRSLEQQAEQQAQLSRLQQELDAMPASDDPQTLALRQATQARIGQLQLELNTTNSAKDSDGGVSLLNSAKAPRSPISPNPERSAGLGLAAGLAAAFGLAFVLEGLDRRIRTETDLLAVVGDLPVVARVPQGEAQDLQRVGAFESGRPFGEAFRTLRTSLQFIQLRKPLRVVQVTSSVEGEGKSTIAANLAVSLAAAGSPVLLIDGDLRRPRVHELFGVPNTLGLSSVMLGEATLEEASVNLVDHPMLRVLPAGPSPANPADFLWPTTTGRGRPTLPTILTTLRTAGWQVVIDSPPVMPVADALTIARMVDGTIVVGQLGKTDRRSLHQALQSLRQTGASLVGVVVNRADASAYRYRPTPAYAYGGWYRRRRSADVARDAHAGVQPASGPEVVDLRAPAPPTALPMPEAPPTSGPDRGPGLPPTAAPLSREEDDALMRRLRRELGLDGGNGGPDAPGGDERR